MAYSRKQFTFFCSYFDLACDMDDRNRLAFYDAIMEYMFKDKDKERTLKRKGLQNAYISFKSVKTYLISSRKKSAAGVHGNEKRWAKDAGQSTNDSVSQKNRKRIANASQLEEEIEEELKEKEKEKETHRTPAACTKCGGVLYRTAMTINAPKGKRRIWRCEKCGEEVEAIE